MYPNDCKKKKMFNLWCSFHSDRRTVQAWPISEQGQRLNNAPSVIAIAFCTSVWGGQRKDLHQASALHWKEAFGGERADPMWGENSSQPDGEASRTTESTDGWTQERRSRVRGALKHGGSYPFPTGEVLALKHELNLFICAGGYDTPRETIWEQLKKRSGFHSLCL